MTTERRYTLFELTGAFGDAIKALQARKVPLDERTLRLVLEATIDRLKAPAIEREDLASPND